MKPKAYTACRPSGIDWIGDLPKDWQIMRLKWIFKTLNGSTPKSSEPNYWDGEIPWATPDDLGSLRGDTLIETRRSITDAGYNSCGTSIAPIGSIILSTRAPIGYLAIAGKAMCANQGCKILVFKNNDNRRFFYYQLVAARPELESFGQGSTFKELAGSKLNCIPLVLPPLDEQRSISAFLDRETADIDGLITKKEQLIELLREKRAALISHAVTKGLDPKVPIKNAGIKWLENIPRNWEVKKLKFVVSFYGGGTPSKGNFDYWTGDIPWVSPKDMKSEFIMDTEDHITEEAVMESATCLIQPGAVLLVVRSGILRHTIPVAVNVRPVALNQDMKALVPKMILQSSYLKYLIIGLQRILLVMWRKEGATVESIEFEFLANTSIPVPPIVEQKEISIFLDHELERLDSLISKIHKAVEKLREYRTALISSAVTGKIDVRQEVA